MRRSVGLQQLETCLYIYRSITIFHQYFKSYRLKCSRDWNTTVWHTKCLPYIYIFYMCIRMGKGDILIYFFSRIRIWIVCEMSVAMTERFSKYNDTLLTEIKTQMPCIYWIFRWLVTIRLIHYDDFSLFTIKSMDIFKSEHPIAIAGKCDGFYSIRYLSKLKLKRAKKMELK